MIASQISSRRPPGARPTIGLLLPALDFFWKWPWLGVVDAAHAHGANVICFAGEVPDILNFNRQKNILYKLVDVERVDAEAPPPLDLLHPDERRLLAVTGAAARPLAFARLWAAKEAYVKALGTGFSRPPESFCVSLLSETRFGIVDPLQGMEAQGELRLMKNGGQDVLAAAAIGLD